MGLKASDYEVRIGIAGEMVIIAPALTSGGAVIPLGDVLHDHTFDTIASGRESTSLLVVTAALLLVIV